MDTGPTTKSSRRRLLQTSSGIGLASIVGCIDSTGENRDDGTVTVDESGDNSVWYFAGSSGALNSSPTVVDGTAYVGTSGTHTEGYEDAALYAVDAEAGEKTWTFSEPSRQIDSAPAVAEGTVYVGSHDGTLYAVNAATGEREWAFTAPTEEIRSSPTVVDGVVYVGGPSATSTDGGDPNHGALYAVDAGVDGSSEDSRVRLGTLGHHGVATEE